MQLAVGLAFTVPLQLFENSNDPALTQAQCLWESEVYVESGKTEDLAGTAELAETAELEGFGVTAAFQPCFEITPKSVKPFTKNCMARATRSRPMMRTRMRIPVSPITVRTRSAPARTQ